MASYRMRKVAGEVRWDATVTRLGAARQTKTFLTKSDAQRWAREVEREIQRGSFLSADAAARTTVNALIDRYLLEEVCKTASRRDAESRSRPMRSSFGRLPLSALTPERVAQYRRARLSSEAKSGGRFGRLQGRKVSTETVRKELLLLKRMIDIGMREWGLHLPAGNPVKMVKLPAPCRARDRRLSPEESKRLIAAAYASKSRVLGPAVELAIETALRRGELMALEWSDIDLNRRVAKVRAEKAGAMKTRTGRELPLSPRAVIVIKSLPRSLSGGPIFGAYKVGSLSQAFARCTKQLGLTNLRWHDLRHEATSRLAEKLNGDVLALAAITGHKTLGMLSRYTHLRSDDLVQRLA